LSYAHLSFAHRTARIICRGGPARPGAPAKSIDDDRTAAMR
jgi:hypothetical protein